MASEHAKRKDANRARRMYGRFGPEWDYGWNPCTYDKWRKRCHAYKDQLRTLHEDYSDAWFDEQEECEYCEHYDPDFMIEPDYWDLWNLAAAEMVVVDALTMRYGCWDEPVSRAADVKEMWDEHNSAFYTPAGICPNSAILSHLQGLGPRI